METTIEFVKGDRVRIAGERGTFKVHRTERNPDGSVSLFGGDMDPNGTQSFRDVFSERLSTDKRQQRKE